MKKHLYFLLVLFVFTVSTLVAQTSGGSMAEGFTWVNSDDAAGPTYAWITPTASADTIANPADDGNTGPIAIGFDFPYYGQTKTQFYFMSNGFIGFNNSSSSLTNVSIPTATTPNDMIAWFWDDLNARNNENGQSTIKYEVITHNSMDALVITMENYAEYPPETGVVPGTLNAQVVLYENGDILMQYASFLGGITMNEATVGVENVDGTNGVLYEYDENRLHDAMAIYWTRMVDPNLPTACSNPYPADSAVDIAHDGTLSWSWGSHNSTYDLWFGPAGAMTEVVTGASAGGFAGTWAYSGLDNFTTYQWQVIAYNSSSSSAIGPVWSFTTSGDPGEVLIGTGTVTGTYLPMDFYWGYTLSQTIYMQSDIDTPNQRIESISYHWNGAYDWTEDEIFIYMGHTSQTELTDFLPLSTFTEVYHGPFTLSLVDGWVTIPLDTPFTYNNSDNLVVMARSNTVSYPGQYSDFYCTAGAGNVSIADVDDNVPFDPANPPTGITPTVNYPNVVLQFGDIPGGPLYHINTSSMDYGLVSVGGSAGEETFTVSNYGLGTLQITDVTLAGANADQFILNDSNSYPVSLGSAVTMDFGVDFVPTSGGDKTAEIQITDDQRVVHTVSLTGEGWAMPFPYFEDFDAGVLPIGWSQDSNDEYDWTINSGTTSSSNTGPSEDHTTGSGYYYYFETTGPVAGDTAILNMPAADLSGVTGPALNFWYNMYGSTMGTLSIDVWDGSTWNNDVWTLSGDQGTDWHEATVDLTPYTVFGAQVRFRAVKGSDYMSDIAIDDVGLFQAQYGDVNGYVYGYNTTSPIEGATVTIGSYSATTNPAGYYEILNVLVGTYDMTADHPLYMQDDVTGVVITDGGVANADFYLPWSEISVDVASFDVTLSANDTYSETMNISNAGNADLEYSITRRWPAVTTRGAATPEVASIIESIEDSNPTGRHRVVTSDRTMWDNQFAYPVDTFNGYGGNTGCETDGEYLYVTVYDYDVISKFDLEGNFIENFTIAGVSALRDLAYDGTYFYGSDASNYIWQMDFNTQTLVSTITTTGPCRAIAYDEASDAFWCNNWASDMMLFDRSGNLLNTLTGMPSMYGAAYDSVSPGGPYLWFFCGTASGGGCWFEQYDMTGVATGVTFDPQTDLGGGIAGGLWIADDIVPGSVTLGGCMQGDYDDIIFGFELQSTWLEMDVTSGTVPAGGSVPILVSFDSATLSDGDDLNSYIVIENNANYTAVRGDDYMIPVHVMVSSLQAPANVMIEMVGDDAVLTWDAATGAAQYHVYYATDPNGAWTEITGSPVTTETFTHVGVGATETKYYYYVTAEN